MIPGRGGLVPSKGYGEHIIAHHCWAFQGGGQHCQGTIIENKIRVNAQCYIPCGWYIGRVVIL